MRRSQGIGRGKNMYGQYLRDMPDTTDVVGTWEWLRKADLKVCTEFP